MTPLDFIASLEHGEAKAAALTVFNLMTPKWVEITDDPATWPESLLTVIIREPNEIVFSERFGWRDGSLWFHFDLGYWDDQSIEPESHKKCMTPTHWRLIG